jgi:hypothetical protein
MLPAAGEWKRNMLANATDKSGQLTGTMANPNIMLYAPTTFLEGANINPDFSLVKFEVTDGAYNGNVYPISSISKNTAVVTGVSEPLNQSQFTFNISNLIVWVNTASVSITSAGTSAGVVTIPSMVEVNNTLVQVDDVRLLITIGNYLEVSGAEYKITQLNGPHTFTIEGWSGGNVSGLTAKIYEHKVEGATGFFNYNGIRLTFSGDLSGTVDIVTNVESSKFIENYLIYVEGYTAPSGDTGTTFGVYYAITDVQFGGTTVFTLAGPMFDFKTTGTSVNFHVYWFQNNNNLVFPEIEDSQTTYDLNGNETGTEVVVYVPGHTFYALDRRSPDIINNDAPTMSMGMGMSSGFMEKIMNAKNDDQFKDSIRQHEQISFKIERRK